ncbi:3065_t:CDS:1 [Funneliformis mosseae]|uniref:3065_t:CDS:1 n=1 Tax=Funneliformis mosseae TaxID=27381 RepID=A0A9N9C8D5_FUNMO|nr:3065_t:CDS:1 [Funneliformis mosseae]
MEYHFIKPVTTYISDSSTKKRVPNAFMKYRAEMMNHRPDNITMQEYSKQVAELWNNMPEEEKDKRKRDYQISRDQTFPHAMNENVDKNAVAVQMGESSSSYPSMTVDQFNQYQTYAMNENVDKNAVAVQMGESSSSYPSMTVDQFSQYQTYAMNEYLNAYAIAEQMREIPSFYQILPNTEDELTFDDQTDEASHSYPKWQRNLLQEAVITNQSEEGSSKIHPSSIYYKYYTL